MAEENGSNRLDRIERALELLINDHVLFREEHVLFREEHVQFREEHKLLLTAQVVLTDHLDKLTARVDKLAEMGQHTDERLNALITTVDALIRRQQ